jgi:26S proteasome regulatory subunit T6
MGVHPSTGEGLRAYYKAKIEELEIQIRDKQHNLRRMEAQRNELNSKGAPRETGWRPAIAARRADGLDRQRCQRLARDTRAVRLLREELQLLQEPGSYVGEVIKVRLNRRARPRRRPRWLGRPALPLPGV